MACITTIRMIRIRIIYLAVGQLLLKSLKTKFKFVVPGGLRNSYIQQYY